MNIVELFQKAQRTLKNPTFRYQSGIGQVKIYIPKKAREDATFRNYLYILVNDIYYAKVTRDNQITFDPRLTIPQEHKDIVMGIFNDPVGKAILHGQKYSNCCFCGLEITNADSLAVGYGPICAEKWDLPHAGMAAKKDLENL